MLDSHLYQHKEGEITRPEAILAVLGKGGFQSANFTFSQERLKGRDNQ